MTRNALWRAKNPEAYRSYVRDYMGKKRGSTWCRIPPGGASAKGSPEVGTHGGAQLLGTDQR
jgi:hypothetical protein